VKFVKMGGIGKVFPNIIGEAITPKLQGRFLVKEA